MDLFSQLQQTVPIEALNLSGIKAPTVILLAAIFGLSITLLFLTRSFSRRPAKIDKTIKESHEEFTVSAYMQVVGIVQALALGYLIATTAPLVFHARPETSHDTLSASSNCDCNCNSVCEQRELLPPQDSLDWLLGLIQALTAFFLIVLTWHVNVQNVIAFRRILSMQDSMIPFLFAIPEYLIISSARPENFSDWTVWLAVFMALAVYAYWQFFDQTRQQLSWFPENRPRFNSVRSYRYSIIAYIAFVAAMTLLAGLVDVQSKLDQLIRAILILVAIAFFAVLHRYVFWFRVIRAPQDIVPS